MSSSQEVTRGYIAGFFDGEGSIGVYRAESHGYERFQLRTQLTQNVGTSADELLKTLQSMYGGNLSIMDRDARTLAHNWQLGGDKAAAFLVDVEPWLKLKRGQARFAIAWQRQRPPRVRNERGHIVYKQPPVLAFDQKVCVLIKTLKKTDLDRVMQDQHDLVEVVHTLRQVLCVKG